MEISLKKSFLVYTSTNLLSTGLPFILLPFLTEYLTESEYGILSNFSGLIALLTPLVGINLVAAFSRQYYKKEVDIASYTATGINFIFLVGLVFSFICYLFEDFISDKTGIDLVLIRVTSIYCFIFALFELVLTKFRVESKVFMFALFRLIRTSIELGFTFLFILKFDYSYFGRCLGILLATAVMVIPCLVILGKSKYLSLKIEKVYLKHLLKFGLPLIPHVLGAIVLAYSDKLIITNKLGLGQNGVYSVAYQIGMVIALVQNSFNQAWVPWFYSKLTNITQEIKNKIVKVTYLYYFSLALIGLIFTFFAPIIFTFIGENFESGQDLVFWVVIGFVFNGFYKMQVNYLFFLEETTVIAITTIFAAIINILLNLYLIDIYSIKGPAIATAITFFLQFVFVAFFAQRKYPMPWLTFKK